MIGDVAQFRELWRVLEAAFGRKDKNLLGRLDRYQPARDLEFKYAELEHLWILRGRASHAESRDGVDELVRVEQECARRLPRLKNLVERVISTEDSWGSRGQGVAELLPLQGYVGPDESP